MNEWWEALTLFQKILWGLASSTSLIFLVQTFMGFLGIDHDLSGGGHELNVNMNLADYAQAGIQKKSTEPKSALFTFKNITVFGMMFGWTSIVCIGNGFSPFLSSLLGLGVGFGSMYGLTWMLRQLLKQTTDGTLNLQKAIGVEGEVYLTIPAKEKGIGKISLIVQGQWMELNAKTSGNEISTGKKIQVIAVLEDGNLLVEETL